MISPDTFYTYCYLPLSQSIGSIPVQQSEGSLEGVSSAHFSTGSTPAFSPTPPPYPQTNGISISPHNHFVPRWTNMNNSSHPHVSYNVDAPGSQAVPVNYNQTGSSSWPAETIDSTHMFNPSFPIQYPPASMLGIGISHVNARLTERRLRALDSRYVNAAKEITKIMSEARASQYFGATLVDNADVHRARLVVYLSTLDHDVQAWIVNCQSAPASCRPDRSKDKKKNEDYDRLFCCLWCNITFTVKHNLANHIRSHIDLHISFCNHCSFSSVCSTLPTRHKCTV